MGTDVTPVSTGKVKRARDEMRERLAAKAGDRDPDAVMESIVQGIFDADSIEGILGSPVVNAETVANRRLRISGFEAAIGDFGPFALIDAVDGETGEIFKVSCGGEVVLAQLIKLDESGYLPIQVVFTVNETRNGQRVIRMARPPAVEVASS